jgi:CIC family chloride channel protein
MALVIAAIASGFLGVLRLVQGLTKRTRLPDWSKPAVGGLLLGALATSFVVFLGSQLGRPGQGVGILGGGYGAAQLAISGISWFPGGWRGVELLLLLGVIKIIATSLTVGTGGSAGDFGPSLVMGGIFGGAFGLAAKMVIHDPRIDPGAFALVGMATFYGGLAHVPIASLVMVCELAGSYDLLVPLMLAEGIAFVVLRNRALYHAQVRTRRESPAHRQDLIMDVLRGVMVSAVMIRNRPFVWFTRTTPAADVLQQVAASDSQDAFPVLTPDGALEGVITAEVLRTLATDPDLGGIAIADDIMADPLSVQESDDLHVALERMLACGAREVPVVDEQGRIVGLLDEAEVTRAYLDATAAKPE